MTRDEEEVLELAKQHSIDLGYIGEPGNGEPVLYEFGKDGLLQFAAALRDRDAKMIAMLRKRLETLVSSGELSANDTDKHQLYCEVKKSDIKSGRKALSSAQPTADAWEKKVQMEGGNFKAE